MKYRIKNVATGQVGIVQYQTLKSAKAAAKWRKQHIGDDCIAVDDFGREIRRDHRYAKKKDDPAQAMMDHINFARPTRVYRAD